MSEYSDASLVLLPSGIKAEKLYSQKPTDGTGDFTVSRASTATRVNEQGLIEEVGVDVARIDYTDCGYGVLLREEQSTNLVLWSEDFSNAVWSKAFATITTNISISPKGNLTADKLTITTQTVGRLSQSYNSAPIGTYTFTIWLKSNEVGKDVNVRFQNFPYPQINVELTNEWQKVSVTITTTSVINLNYRIIDFGATNPPTELFVWGATLEESSTSSSYIKTEGTTVTRIADEITVAPPVGVTSITETIDSVEQAPITVIPTTYQIPNGNINKIIMK